MTALLSFRCRRRCCLAARPWPGACPPPRRFNAQEVVVGDDLEPGFYSSWFFRTIALPSTPYEKTLQLDTDTVLCHSIDDSVRLRRRTTTLTVSACCAAESFAGPLCIHQRLRCCACAGDSCPLVQCSSQRLTHD